MGLVQVSTEKTPVLGSGGGTDLSGRARVSQVKKGIGPKDWPMQKGLGWEKAQFRTLPTLQMGKTEAQGGWSLRSLQPPMWPQPTALPGPERMTSQVTQDHGLGPARWGQQNH